MNYGVRDYAGGVADLTTLRLDQLMLGAMASNVANGLYIIAVRLSEVTTLAADAIAKALMPEVAAVAERKAESLWATSLRLTIYLHALMLAPLWLGAPYILRTLFGESFVSATPAFRWLLFAAAVWGWASIVISGLRGFGYPGLSTVGRFAGAVVTAIALVILLPRLGITGAAETLVCGNVCDRNVVTSDSRVGNQRARSPSAKRPLRRSARLKSRTIWPRFDG